MISFRNALALSLALVASDAMAGPAPNRPARPEDKGMSAIFSPTPASRGLYRNGAACGLAAAAPVSDDAGHVVGYECIESANGG